jgi:hypothetical protein
MDKLCEYQISYYVIFCIYIVRKNSRLTTLLETIHKESKKQNMKIETKCIGPNLKKEEYVIHVNNYGK